MDFCKRVTMLAKATSLNGQGLGDVDILEEVSNCLEMPYVDVERTVLQATERDFQKFVQEVGYSHTAWVRAESER